MVVMSLTRLVSFRLRIIVTKKLIGSLTFHKNTLRWKKKHSNKMTNADRANRMLYIKVGPSDDNIFEATHGVTKFRSVIYLWYQRDDSRKLKDKKNIKITLNIWWKRRKSSQKYATQNRNCFYGYYTKVKGFSWFEVSDAGFLRAVAEISGLRDGRW